MQGYSGKPPREAIRFKDIYGVFALSPDEVQFRTGSTSGPVCVVSDPERRGLLSRVIERLLLPNGAEPRPWNVSEAELLDEVIPQLRQSGIIEADDETAGVLPGSSVLAPGKSLSEARIAIVGHGALGQAIRSVLAEMACRPITMIESSSVAISCSRGSNGSRPATLPRADAVAEATTLSRPRHAAQWVQALGDHDWIVAAQDCFEPEEMTELNKAALQLSVPWSMVCFDGHEGWVGPTFVPRQTACFECFRKRLFAGMPESQHAIREPGVKVHRLPSPWSTGPGSGPWISLITSMFALELVAAIEGRSFMRNHMVVVHRLNLTFHRETVLRLPRCAECSPRAGAPRLNVFSHVLTTRGNLD